MTANIVYLLAISCASIIWVKGLPFVYYIKLFKRAYFKLPENKLPRVKPFDCESCLTFWGSLGLMVQTSPIPEALAISLIAYVFTALLTRIV